MPYPIACAACGKTFSITDDLYERKIVGHVVTIKCKQCQANIRVDGTQANTAKAAPNQASDDATPPADASPAPAEAPARAEAAPADAPQAAAADPEPSPPDAPKQADPTAPSAERAVAKPAPEVRAKTGFTGKLPAVKAGLPKDP